MSPGTAVKNTFYAILVTFGSIHYSNGVPDPYCLQPINTDDCGGDPTPVFHYYLPGSRCEIKIWKGCRTRNKFDNEATCSHFCIGSLKDSKLNEIPHGDGADDGNGDLNGQGNRPGRPLTPEEQQREHCRSPFNENDCEATPLLVYTYNHVNQTCEKKMWKGCTTENIFVTEIECMEKCQLPDCNYWVRKMERLNSGELNQVVAFFQELEKTTPAYISDYETLEKGTGPPDNDPLKYTVDEFKPLLENCPKG